MKYHLNVYWTMAATVEVEADSLDNAVKQAKVAFLPENGEYLEGSFEVDKERLAEDYPNEISSFDYGLEDLPLLHIKAFNALMRSGVDTVAKLLKISKEQLEAIIPKGYFPNLMTSVHEAGLFFPWENIVAATFVSVWDGGATRIESDCNVSMDTREVFAIGQADVSTMDLDILDHEEVLIDGKIYPVYRADSDDDEWEEGDFWYV